MANPQTMETLRGLVSAAHAAGDSLPAHIVVDGEVVDLAVDNTEPKVVLKLDSTTVQEMMDGELDGTAAFISQRLIIEGDMMVATQISKIMAPDRMELGSEKAGDTNDNIIMVENLGLIVKDLEGARTTMEKMGFNMSPLGNHRVEGKDGEFTQFGTGNHLANFSNLSFLELITHYIPERTAGLYGDQLKRYGNHWGKMTIKIKSSDTEVERLRRQGHPIEKAGRFYRYHAEDGFSLDHGGTKRSKLVSYPSSMIDDYMVIAMEHFDDGFPIPEEHFNHPNGVQKIAFSLIGTDNPAAAAARYAEDISIKATERDGDWVIEGGQDTTIIFRAKDRLPANLQHELGDRGTYLLAPGYKVKSLSETKAFLEKAGFASVETDLGLMVERPIEGTGTSFFIE